MGLFGPLTLLMERDGTKAVTKTMVWSHISVLLIDAK
jgi:hypothetical protein